MMDVNSAFKADVEDAVSFIESDIAPQREAATRFYNAEPFGDEEEGRSQYVDPVVRDTVRATLPSLIRTFFGGTRVVEFIGAGDVSAEIADEMTDAVEHIVTRENEGFSIFHAAFKDALVRKVGWLMWWYDESIVVTGKTFSNCSEDQVAEMNAALKQGEEELKVLERTQVGEIPAQPPQQVQTPMGVHIVPGQPAQPVFSYKVQVISKTPVNKIRLAAVPPEEIFINRDAVSPYDCRLVGRRRMMTKGDLRALGISEEILAAAATDDKLEFNREKQARSESATNALSVAATDDQKQILYVEAFYRVDADGDGISELRKICAVGSNLVETHNDYADEVTLAGLCPDPEPHTPWGLSQADNVADLQVIGSHVTRDIFDSLKQSIFSRMAYVEGQANIDDILNTEIGGPIRMRAPGMVTPFVVPFVGQEAFPVLDYLDNRRESRTGIGKSAQGLDPRALQSTNQLAVNAAVTASQAQPDLIARIFAETGMKRLFRGLAKMVIDHMSEGFEIPKNGKMVRVNPKDWNKNAQLAVDPSLGTGNTEQRLSVLNGVANTQATILRELGIDNPLCSLQELYNTQTRMLRYSGFRDVHRFFTNPTEKSAEMEPKEPDPTPEQVLADAQMKIEAGKLNVDRLKLILEDDRERDQMEVDMLLKVAEIKATTGMQVDIAAINAAITRQRDVARAAVDIKKATAS